MIEIGPNLHRWLEDSRVWIASCWTLYLWTKLAMAIVLRPRGGRQG